LFRRLRPLGGLIGGAVIIISAAGAGAFCNAISRCGLNSAAAENKIARYLAGPVR